MGAYTDRLRQKIHGGAKQGEVIIQAYGNSKGTGKTRIPNMFGEYREPELKPDKGEKGGSCNRTACQRPGAIWYNRAMYKWYCSRCARMLNEVRVPGGSTEDEPLCKLDDEAREIYNAKCLEAFGENFE